MRNLRLLPLFVFWTSLISAQVITGELTTIEGLPLIGASVYWEGTNDGTITDENGLFEIDKASAHTTLIFSYVGFKTQTIKVGDLNHWEIQLIEDSTLAAIEIRDKSKATRFEDAPAKIEVIGTREIERAACCSLSGCFSTNSSVTSATTNVITDAKELQLLGLSGVYNQILFDGMPYIQGLSYLYGSGSYPGTLLKAIYVAKGSNSVLQGVEGISGQINIIPKDPAEEPTLYLNAFANSFGESQYNANYSINKNKVKNLLTAHLTLPAQKIDLDGDGFRNIVSTNRMSFYNKFSFGDPENDRFKFQIGTRFWTEQREGGSMDYEHGLSNENIYGQHVDLNQIDIYGKSSFSLTEDLSITLMHSFMMNEQTNNYGGKIYDASQTIHTSSLFSDFFYGNQDYNIKLGVQWVENDLKQNITIPEKFDFLTYAGNYDQKYSLPGAFLEHTLNHNKITLITGLRLNRYDDIGLRWIPRGLLRIELNENADLRFSAGKGYRIAQPFAERINLLSSNRNIFLDENLRPEESINIGTNFVQSLYFEKWNWTISADFYITKFQNQIFPDYDRSPALAFVENFYGNSTSESFQLENKIEIGSQFDFKIAYNYLNLYQIRDGAEFQLPFVAKHKMLTSASYTTLSDAWQFDLNYSWQSAKRLPDTSLYPENYQLANEGESYGILTTQITRRWEKFQIYGGVENILNFYQQFPILAYDDPFGPYFDPAFVWGPTKGIEFYLGVRYNIE